MNFLIYEEHFLFFFNSVQYTVNLLLRSCFSCMQSCWEPTEPVGVGHRPADPGGGPGQGLHGGGLPGRYAGGPGPADTGGQTDHPFAHCAGRAAEAVFQEARCS
jgi:hypothetical protein